MITLGCTYTDVITGLNGIAIGRAVYISGCTQVLLQPKGTAEKPRPDGEWFDEQRLQLVPDAPAVTLDNRDTPGCDRPAPKR